MRPLISHRIVTVQQLVRVFLPIELIDVTKPIIGLGLLASELFEINSSKF